MTKKIIQDIIIKNVKNPAPVPAERQAIRSITSIPVKPREDLALPKKETYLPPEWSGKKKSDRFSKTIKWLIFLAVVILALGGLAKTVSIFSSAIIKVTPKTKTLAINSAFTARSEEAGENVYFQTAELSYEATKSITASSQKVLNQKSSGTVALFNNNSKNQFLVKETRLETPDGKIYKTEKSVTIPANSSVDVTVFADQSGQSYNIGLTDFKLPGFKGSPKYETVLGRSRTEIGGGFVGQASVLSAEELDSAQKELRAEVEEYLTKSIEQNKPLGFLAFPGSTKIEFATSTDNPVVGAAGESFEIKQSARAYVHLIKADDLERKLTETLKSQLTPASDSGLRISNLNNLNFTLNSAQEDGRSINFALKGNATFVWNANKDSLLGEMRATKPSDYNKILQAHPEIEKAEITFSPSWWKFIPRNEATVKYEEILPN